MTNWAVPLLVAILALIGSGYTAWLARRSQHEQSEIQRSKVDIEAFERARVTYDQIIKQLDEQVQRLKRNLDSQMQENYTLKLQVMQLETTVKLLRQSLTLAGITPPDVPNPPQLNR